MNFSDSDLIAQYTLYHKKTPMVPQGRILVFCDKECVLLDSPLPYKDIPIYRIAPSEHKGTSFGYTIGFDCLPSKTAWMGLLQRF